MLWYSIKSLFLPWCPRCENYIGRHELGVEHASKWSLLLFLQSVGRHQSEFAVSNVMRLIQRVNDA